MDLTVMDLVTPIVGALMGASSMLAATVHQRSTGRIAATVEGRDVGLVLHRTAATLVVDGREVARMPTPSYSGRGWLTWTAPNGTEVRGWVDRTTPPVLGAGLFVGGEHVAGVRPPASA